MATLARPGRPLAPRVQRAYRLEMAGRTVFLLLTLLTLTGLVVFYLGVITGKGLRDPNEGVVANSVTAPGTAVPGAATATDPKATAPVQPTALNHALQSPTGQIEGLKSDESAANQKTKQLVASAKQELALDEVKPSSTVTAPVSALTAPAAAKTGTQPTAPAPAKPVQTAKKPAPVHPAKRPAAVAKAPMVPAAPAIADGDGPFIVQVFSSPQQTHAQEILADLKKKGFPAYMNQFQAADKRTWYRVRVGKSIGARAEADALANRIKSSSTNVEPRVMKQ